MRVKNASSTDECYYIVPLCPACNKRTDTFEVPEDSLVPVPSNL